ncbi:sodium-and chloride-dependent [Lynx pardinus]|uniref:Transporter n=1 Tax=Lynx pardinus TaxID=191816 RepID=A0A485MAA4_LYNPA|nr:sodium-and chloride-dependent [Lynx pardinus]
MEKARPLWANPLQFVFACISYAVGLGNVWRFPYLCQMYGGGSFLVPYFVMLVVEGMPLLYLELTVGQRMRQGSIGAWRTISPYLGGVGLASVVVSFFLSTYYNIINAWAFWYLFHSFQDPLPWSVCPLNGNRTGYDEECEKASSTQYFWYRKTLNISPSIQDSGGVQWEQALCLLLAWLVVYLCILRGTESTGKVVYFTALLPYCVLIIYLVRGLTLHGATNGLAYMFTPKLEQLANPKAWINAATQIFFSLGLGFGSLIAFASYNQPSTNCQQHAIIVSLINSSTSIFASVVTFSIYGFKATFNYESCLNKVILLLTNSFDLEDGFLTTSNLEQVKGYLASAFPGKYSEVLPQIRNCSLESELATVRQDLGLLLSSERSQGRFSGQPLVSDLCVTSQMPPVRFGSHSPRGAGGGGGGGEDLLVLTQREAFVTNFPPPPSPSTGALFEDPGPRVVSIAFTPGSCAFFP